MDPGGSESPEPHRRGLLDALRHGVPGPARIVALACTTAILAIVGRALAQGADAGTAAVPGEVAGGTWSDPRAIPLAIAFLLLLVSSGLISASETAIFSLTRFDQVKLRRRRGPGARTLPYLLDRPNETLTTILALNNLVNVCISLAGGALSEIRFAGEAQGLAIAAFGTTAALLVFGEVLPKCVAHATAPVAAPWLSLLIAPAARLLAPVRFVMNAFLRRVFHLLGIDEPRPEAEVSEEELKAVMSAGEVTRLFEEGERDMISGVFDLRHTFAEEIMTPRGDVVAIPRSLSQEDALALMRGRRVNRLPVHDESPDHIVGFVLAKEVLLNPSRPWTEMIREILCVPPRVRLLDLLERFRRDSTKIAAVVDEYGGFAGIVTLHDLMEEIVGDMTQAKRGESPEFQETSPGRWTVLGRMNLDDLQEAIGVPFPDDMGTTVAGFVMNRGGRIPTVGETVRHENLLLRVKTMTGRRIVEIEIERSRGEGADEAPGAASAGEPAGRNGR